MYTGPIVIAARHAGIDVFRISVNTELGVEGKNQEVSHQEVIKNAKKNEKNLILLVEELVGLMH